MSSPVGRAGSSAGSEGFTADRWLHVIADRLRTADLDYCQRLLHAWMQAVGDQLDRGTADEVSRGLPVHLRAELCSGAHLCLTAAARCADRFVSQFCRAARVSVAEVHFGAVAITIALGELLSPEQLDAILGQLPDDVRAVLAPVNRFTAPKPAIPGSPPSPVGRAVA